MPKLIAISQFFPKSHFSRFAYYSIVVFIAALLDFIGVGSIVPFLAIMLDPTFIEEIRRFDFLVGAIPSERTDQIIVFGSVAVVMFGISLLVRMYANVLQVHFALKQELFLSRTLFKSYLAKPYLWHLQNDSSEIVKNIVSEVGEYINRVLYPILIIISQGALVFVMSVALIVVNWKATFAVIGIFFACYALIFVVLRERARSLGVERIEKNKLRFRVLRSALSEIREIKMRDANHFFDERFKSSSQGYINSLISGQLYSEIPRYFIEGLGVLILVFASLVMTKGEHSFIQVFPVIAVYAVVGYRVLPAAQQLYSSIVKLKFGQAVLLRLSVDISYAKKLSEVGPMVDFGDKSLPTSAAELVSLENVTFRYPGQNQKQLVECTLNIQKGEKVFISGVSGSGKSTFLNLICGLLDPTNGSVRRSIGTHEIGLVSQYNELSCPTIAENVAFGVPADVINRDLVWSVLKTVELASWVRCTSNGLDSEIGENAVQMSGGQRQRLAIARALYFEPKLLLLDEATSGLDSATEAKILQRLMGDKNLTLLFSSHKNHLKTHFAKEICFEAGVIATSQGG